MSNQDRNKFIEAGKSSKGDDVEVLFLASTDGAHTGRSGYTILSEYFPKSHLIEAHRKPADNIIKRLSDAVVARISLSRWCRRSSFRMELQALKLLRKKNIQIVHHLWGDRDIGFIDFFKKKRNLKLVASLHNCASMLEDTYNFPKRFANFDALILMSKVQQSYFEKAGVPPEKIHVVLHGIDCDHFKPDPNIKKDEFTLLSVGSWQRNFPLLQEIAVELGKISDIKIKIISSQKFRPLFEGQKNVIFQSRLSNEELLKAYQQASCFIMTADDATANNAVVEALGCGLPVITEPVGGIPEYVNDECAFFCRDAASFVQRILQLSNSKELQQQMSNAARLRAEELDWKRSAERIQQIYKQL